MRFGTEHYAVFFKIQDIGNQSLYSWLFVGVYPIDEVYQVLKERKEISEINLRTLEFTTDTVILNLDTKEVTSIEDWME